MNKIKKLSIVLVALAMCMMLGVTGWAANSVSYSVEPKQATVCVSEGMQMVTVTLKASEDIQITSMYLEVIMPTNWSINTIRNDTLGITEDNYHTTKDPVAEKHCVVWIEPESGNKTIKAGETLLAIDYDVPANAKGIFTLGVENLELATMKDGYNLEVLTKETTVTTTVTIADHAWGDPSYTDNKDGTHTANYVCGNDASHTKSDAPAVEHTYDETTHKCVCGAEEPAPAGLKGDVNLDGVVDMDDVIALLRHVMKDGDGVIDDPAVLALSEVTGDTSLDMDDVIKLLRYVMKDGVDSLE